MALSYDELTTPPTEDEQLTTLLELATLAGFPATSWQPGSVPRTLLQIEATTLVELATLIASIGKGGLLDEAEGDWLDLLAESLFDEEKDAVAILKWKEILDMLEGASDRCKDVATVLEGIFVKHA